MVGDYIATAFSGGTAYPAFAVARRPARSVFDEAIYTRTGLAVPTAASRVSAEASAPVAHAADQPAPAAPLSAR